MSAADSVRDLVEPLLAVEAIELVDVELEGSTLRVTVERPEGGIDLDGVTVATRVVSGALDSADPLPGRYVLEVSSPGVERPLRTPTHFRRAVGSRLAVKLRAGAAHDADDRRLDGELTAAGDAGITLDGRTLAYADIERARTIFTWGPAARTQKPPAGNRSRKQPGLNPKAHAR